LHNSLLFIKVSVIFKNIKHRSCTLMSRELYQEKTRQADLDSAKNSLVPGEKLSGANESEFCRYGFAILG